ncbi:MAG: hypothetical protein WKG01_29980 [Kofleriaceae bacterium]
MRLTPSQQPSCDQVDLADFVAEHSDCLVQERWGRAPADFKFVTLGEFYAEARREVPIWAIDRDQGRYVFHDNLLDANDPSSAERIDEFVNGHPPTDEFVELSRRLPCVGLRFALGGPDSGTPTPHVHGAVQCLVLAGQKRWWIWPPSAELVIDWLVRGMQARNRLEYWMTHLAPIFAGQSGDVTVELFEAIEELTRRGIFLPSTLDPRSEYDAELFARLGQVSRERRGILAEDFQPRAITQLAGQSVYLPEGWSHSVRNQEWCLAVIYELRRDQVLRR